MRYPYSNALNPPGLIVPVTILDFEGRKSNNIRAEIDTGAGITSIPNSLVKSLNLKPFGSVEARGPFDDYKVLYTYLISFKFEDGRIFDTKAIKSRREYTLIGRDIINQLKIIADGPNNYFEIN